MGRSPAGRPVASPETERAQMLARLAAARRVHASYRARHVVRTDAGRVLYRPTAKQDELHGTEARYVLYGGAAGGGKSHGLRWDAMLKCLRVPEVRALFLRRTYPELERSHLLDLPIEVPSDMARYNAAKHDLRFPNGSIVVFGHLQDERALQGYLSSQWDLIYIDQAESFTPRMLRLLRGRLRTTKKEVRTQMILAANPGGDGHLYLHQHFIERMPPASETPNYRQEDWCFLPAFVWDNPHMQDDYVDELLSFTGPERDAYLYGKWTAFEGQFFREWDPAVHVITGKAAADLELPSWMPREGGMDWGYSPDPWVLLVAAFDAYGRATAYRELHGTEMTPQEVADAIDRGLPEGRMQPITVHAAPDMRRRGVESGVSIMDQINERLAEHGSQIVLEPANNDRVNGWMRVRSYLSSARQRPDRPGHGPYLQVVAETPRKMWGCPYLIATMPAQRHHATRKGDMASSVTDHAPDALRYLLYSREPLAVVPEEARPPVPHHQRVQSENMKRLAAMMRHASERHAVLEGELPEGPAVDPFAEDLAAAPEANVDDAWDRDRAVEDFY